MPPKKRILRVTLESQSGKKFYWTEGLALNVKIRKASLHIQNSATIEVYGLTKNVREGILSQFTAYNRRLARQNTQTPWEWVNVTIEAGYEEAGRADTSIVFMGQVVMCEPISAPPTIGFRVTCFTNQIDKTKFLTEPAPARLTYYDYVKWAAGQMGFGQNFVCKTSYNDQIITNPARSINTVQGLLIDIQNKYRSNVAAYIDDNRLVVLDRGKVIDENKIAEIDSFIGMPGWTEWGVEFTTLFNPNIRLAQGVFLTSEMNPSLNNGYVVMELEYTLSSRDRPFYITVNANPPA